MRKIHRYRNERFRVNMRSPHRATVNVVCGEHRHDFFIIGLIEEISSDWVRRAADDNDSDWAVGWKEGGTPIKGDFESSVNHAADRLLEECYAMRSVAAFFGDEVKSSSVEKLKSYQGREYVVKSSSPISAKMNIVCKNHKHRDFIIGLAGHEVAGWLTGRPEAERVKYGIPGEFASVVEQTANLLLRECLSMQQVDKFFGTHVEVESREDEDQSLKELDALLGGLEREFDRIDQERDEK